MVSKGPISDLTEAAQACACFNLRKTTRAITQLYDAALEPSGVRATQFSVLVALALADGAPLGRLAEGLVMDRTTLTRNLRPLERQGWVRAEPGPDRRERYLSLTRSGRAALDRALPLWKAVQSGMVESIGAARWRSMRGDLAAALAAAQQMAPHRR